LLTIWNDRVEDESTRYVAEENVMLLSKEELDGMGEVHELFPIEIGMWFLRYDKVAGRFVSNVKEEYPDD
jgi:hypothetical protein